MMHFYSPLAVNTATKHFPTLWTPEAGAIKEGQYRDGNRQTCSHIYMYIILLCIYKSCTLYLPVSRCSLSAR